MTNESSASVLQVSRPTVTPNVRVRYATETDAALFIDILVQSTVECEPVCRALGVTPQDARILYSDYIPYVLTQGLSVMVLEGNECIGIIVMHIKERGECFYTDYSSHPSKGLRMISKLLQRMTANIWDDLPPHFNKILHGMDTAVTVKKGAGIFKLMVDYMIENAIRNKCQAIVSELLSSNTKYVYRLGYVRIRTIPHETFLDENGNRALNIKGEECCCTSALFLQNTYTRAKL